MTIRNISRLAIAVALGLAVSSAAALAQTKTLKEQLVGSWVFADGFDTQKDGSKKDRWGKGIGSLMFDANGRFSQIISRSDIPKFAKDSADQGTDAENRAVLTNITVSFGTYKVNEADKSLITTIEGGTFPNRVGSENKRIVTSLTADDLTYINPTNSVGASANAHWKRAK
jgi:hypothetical protein